MGRPKSKNPMIERFIMRMAPDFRAEIDRLISAIMSSRLARKSVTDRQPSKGDVIRQSLMRGLRAILADENRRAAKSK